MSGSIAPRVAMCADEGKLKRQLLIRFEKDLDGAAIFPPYAGWRVKTTGDWNHVLWSIVASTSPPRLAGRYGIQRVRCSKMLRSNP
jgi:hypothetical protein